MKRVKNMYMIMTKKIKNFVAILFIAIVILANLPTPVFASDFIITVDRIYTLDPETDTVDIEEIRHVQSFSPSYYIPKGSKETFFIQIL